MTPVPESLTGRLPLVEPTPIVASELTDPTRLRRHRLVGGFADGGIIDGVRILVWQLHYLDLLVQRDLPIWGFPAHTTATNRLIRMLASVLGQEWNASQIGGTMALSYHTLNRHPASRSSASSGPTGRECAAPGTPSSAPGASSAATGRGSATCAGTAGGCSRSWATTHTAEPVHGQLEVLRRNAGCWFRSQRSLECRLALAVRQLHRGRWKSPDRRVCAALPLLLASSASASSRTPPNCGPLAAQPASVRASGSSGEDSRRRGSPLRWLLRDGQPGPRPAGTGTRRSNAGN